MDINTGKQLLVDDRIVEDIWNVRREMVRPAKFIDNPLMVADRPWEDKGVASCYVLFDEQENIFKIMLYTDVFDMPTREAVAQAGGIDGEWSGRSGVCMAYSADGIQVEVLSEQGEIVAGYERTSSMVFSGDSLRQQIQWKDGRTMGASNGRRVRLKFYLSNATLYSFAIKNCA